MCTVTWLFHPEGYDLLCSRDEKRTRARALPPALHWRDGVRYLAPVDAEGGGSWIAVNEYALTLCLLNGTPARRNPLAAGRSRGLVLLEMAAAHSAADARVRFGQADFTGVAPFVLLALEPGREAAVAEWNGCHTTTPSGAVLPLLASSSFDPAGAMERRRRDFLQRRPAAAEDLFDFHRSHAGGPGPYSTCMHRGDAETVSLSCISVRRRRIEYTYYGGPPCRRPPVARAALTLRRRA